LSISPDPFSIISLSIPLVEIPGTGKTRIPTLMDCFSHYCAGETLEGTNAWYNEKTGKYQNVKRGIAYWSLPNIMIIPVEESSIQKEDNFYFGYLTKPDTVGRQWYVSSEGYLLGQLDDSFVKVQ
jgi:ubiquitin C-terminal hydrolase